MLVCKLTKKHYKIYKTVVNTKKILKIGATKKLKLKQSDLFGELSKKDQIALIVGSSQHTLKEKNK